MVAPCFYYTVMLSELSLIKLSIYPTIGADNTPFNGSEAKCCEYNMY